MIAALLFGLLLPATRYLIPWNTLFLQIIFFLSCLKINVSQLNASLKDWRFLALANIAKLIVFPVLAWLFIHSYAPDLGLALFLLAAMPVGMTAPLLVEVIGGKQTTAMVLTVTTSLLAPLTIPILVKFLYGASISVDTLGMFKQLALVIFLPFIIALIVKQVVPKLIDRVKTKTKPVSILLLGLLIAGAVAKQSHQIISLSQDWWKLLTAIAALYLFFLLSHAIGYFIFYWKKTADKSTASVSLTYMNFTLAIFLAAQFFPKPEVLLPLVLSILPWATLPAAWKWMIKKYTDDKKR